MTEYHIKNIIMSISKNLPDRQGAYPCERELQSQKRRYAQPRTSAKPYGGYQFISGGMSRESTYLAIPMKRDEAFRSLRQ